MTGWEILAIWFVANIFAALAVTVRAYQEEYPHGSTPTHKPSDGRRYDGN